MQAVRRVVFMSMSSAIRSKMVFNGASDAVRGSHVWRRGRSFAASVPSDSSQPQKSQKRISKNERRAMVESFVHKYRSLNAGKFPTTTVTKKEVGGSYYVIRQFIQEIEYACKIFAVSNKDEVLLEKQEKVILPHFDVKEDPQISTVTGDSSLRTVCDASHDLETINNTKMEEASPLAGNETPRKQFAEEKQQVSSQIESYTTAQSVNHNTRSSPFSESIKEGVEVSSIKNKAFRDSPLEAEMDWKDCSQKLANVNLQETNEDFSEHRESSISMAAANSETSNIQISSDGHYVLDGKSRHHMELESGTESLQPVSIEVTCSRTDETASKNLEDLDSLKREFVSKADIHVDEVQKFQRDSKKSNHEEESSLKRSTLWGNLKSFADGIINLWRTK